MKRTILTLGLTVALAVCGCSRPQPSAALGVKVLRNGAPDPGALDAMGAMAGAAPLRDFTCDLHTVNADHLANCGFRLHGGNVVFGPYATLPPGRYVANFQLDAGAACRGGSVTLDVVTSANGFTALAQHTAVVNAADTEHLAFVIDPSLADSAPLEFRVSAAADTPCLDLHRVTVRLQ